MGHRGLTILVTESSKYEELQGESRNRSNTVSVSYTHLDVYKRQTPDLSNFNQSVKSGNRILLHLKKIHTINIRGYVGVTLKLHYFAFLVYCLEVRRLGHFLLRE